jgi:hypothetical protein
MWNRWTSGLSSLFGTAPDAGIPAEEQASGMRCAVLLADVRCIADTRTST